MRGAPPGSRLDKLRLPGGDRGYSPGMTASESQAEARKAISVLDHYVAAGGDTVSFEQARYAIMVAAGFNGVDDVDPRDPDAKAPTKAQLKAAIKVLDTHITAAENVGQAYPFEVAKTAMESDAGLAEDGDD